MHRNKKNSKILNQGQKKVEMPKGNRLYFTVKNNFRMAFSKDFCL